MMKKVFLIVMILLGCGAAMKQGNAQSINYVYDTVGPDIVACSGSVVRLVRPTPPSNGYQYLYAWYVGDTNTSFWVSSDTAYSVTFAGTDISIWLKRTAIDTTNYQSIRREVYWQKRKIRKEIVDLQPDTLVACDSYVWHKPSGGTATLDSSGVYRDTVSTERCSKLIYTLNLTIPRGLDTTVTTPWCFPNHHWRDVTLGEPISIGGRTGYLFEHDTIGGCRVTDTIIVTTPRHTIYDTVDTSACEFFVWPLTGESLYSSGSYFRQTGLLTSLGCDSIRVLNLTIDTTKRGDTTVIACDSYTWIDGYTYVNSTTTTHTIERSFADGCDSIVHLHLTINRSTTSEENQHACDSYTWHRTTYTATDTFRFDTLNAEGCTHTIWLNLTVNYTKYGDTIVDNACDSYIWDVNGKTYSFDEDSGSINHILANHRFSYATKEGCDSIVYLDLKIGKNNYFETSEDACEEYTWTTWQVRRYDESGVYVDSTDNNSGCKDYYQLNLTINHVRDTGESWTECGSEYFWAETGDTYRSSGRYLGEPNYDQCERKVLYLTLLGIDVPPDSILRPKNLDTIRDCMMLIYPRAKEAPTYFYQWMCNDKIIPNETKQYFVFKPSQYRGDSISVKVSGIEFGLLDACYRQTKKFGVPDTPLSKVVAQPNPNRGKFSVTLTKEDDPVVEAVLYNAYGIKVTAVRASAGVAYFDEALQPGMYLVVVTTQSGRTYTDKVVVDR